MDRCWERRKYVRIPDKLRITYEILSDKRMEEYITKDISRGGIRFLAHEFIPKDSHLKISFTFKSYINYNALVRVVWINESKLTCGYEVGVEFINIPKEAQEYIIEYIKTCLSSVVK